MLQTVSNHAAHRWSKAGLRLGNFVSRYSRQLFSAPLALGQINMRKVDGWQSLATKPINQLIDLAA